MFEIKETKVLTSEILNQCREKFEVYCYLDDKKVDKDFPSPKKITIRYFKKSVEADEELSNKSAEDLEKEGIKGITLRERLIMELLYFKETGEHLDIENVTLCTGSRRSDGGVPGVYWRADSRGLYVHWCSTALRSSHLRSRAEVSNPLSFSSLPLDLEKAIKIVKEAGLLVFEPK